MQHLWTLQEVYKTHFVAVGMFCTPVARRLFSRLCATRYESDTWEAAYRFGVVGLPYGALSGGTLTGKYLDGTKCAAFALRAT